ncbi:cell wall hydrolase [Acetobacter sp. TBRC 12305]|uniref:Cell wall hydrolase n=1 Tax=Acetobacter garciniae TaxID=2817435 RepID=A0A939HQ72_9PROT|nr:cell wall hydrolase [Acetobacter garciniae]MBO1326841.1 cell wall hydrolase [Acetobacter garciniae]MBX0346566.1 cell wall hydrolase [Acetobacter garciniae]
MLTLPLTDPTQAAARTAWGEARGEGARGMLAVLGVIGNRAARPAWWGHDIAGVCMARWQFSCWNPSDPNRAQALTVTDSDPQFKKAQQMAALLVSGALPDITNGADSYYDTRMPRPPAWAAPQFYRCTIGRHAFFRMGPFGEG